MQNNDSDGIISITLPISTLLSLKRISDVEGKDSDQIIQEAIALRLQLQDCVPESAIDSGFKNLDHSIQELQRDLKNQRDARISFEKVLSKLVDLLINHGKLK